MLERESLMERADQFRILPNVELILIVYKCWKTCSDCKAMFEGFNP